VALLTRAFFERSPLEVAPDLLSCVLIHEIAPGERLVGRLVEVEAYLGDRDPGSHAYRGPTPRNRVMFGPPGHLYAYRSMGIHTCLNAVCEATGRAGAVLLRGVEPLEGHERMRAHRGRDGYDLTNGPGKLAQAFGVRVEANGRSLLRGSLRLERAPRGYSLEDRGTLCGPRVGLSRGAGLRYRFLLEDSPWVTRTPLNRLARVPQRRSRQRTPILSGHGRRARE
jgi:DNA-3-methyladenine glycosylase